MSYIGNEPTSVAFLTDTFSGNGSTTAFTLSAAPATTSSILVAITGVLQDPSTYSVSGTTLTFSPAPPTGTGNISVRFLGIPASGVTTTAYRTVTEFTATSGQTTFSVPSYTVGFIDVYRNGVMLGSADYTASNGLTVVLASGATAGDLVEVISFQVSSVLNAIPASPSSVGTSNLVDGSVTTAKIANSAVTRAKMGYAGAVLQVVSTTKSDTSSISAAKGVWSDVPSLSVSITPISASSKILVTGQIMISTQGGYPGYSGVRILRGATAIGVGDAAGSRAQVSANVLIDVTGGAAIATFPYSFLDSPSTTSLTTYKIQVQQYVSSGTATTFINRTTNDTDDTPFVRGVSVITLMEIAG